MKKLLFYILIFGLGCISCYEDNSNKSIEPIAPILIDMGNMPSQFYVYQYGDLKVVPVIYKEGLNDNDLYFEWRLNGFGANRLLGTGMILDAPIYEEQQSDPYTLLLTVTDTTTWIKEVHSWKVQVTSRLSTGLMVADTKDGNTGDLSLIMAYNFTNLNNDKQDTIFHHIYSKGNGQGSHGPIIGLVNSNYSTERVTTLLSSEDMVRMNPASYVKKEEMSDLFYLSPDHKITPMAIQFLDETYPGEYLLESGLLYYRDMWSRAKKFGYYYQMNDESSYAISDFVLFPRNTSRQLNGVAFDSLNNRFVGLPDDAQYGQLIPLSNNGGIFNPANLGNKECLFLGMGKDKKIQAILKDRATGDCFIYTMLPIMNQAKVEVVGIADLSDCKNIRKAEYFTFSPLEEVMYYTIGNEIYAVLLTSDRPQSHECFKTLLDEDRITSLMIWQKQGKIYYTPDDDGKDRTMNSASRMLVITTYNGTEGKVFTLPIENLGAGVISSDRKYHKEYKGFNKITAIAPQDK